MTNDIIWSTHGSNLRKVGPRDAKTREAPVEPIDFPSLVRFARGHSTWAQLMGWTPSSIAGASEVGRQLYLAGRLDEAKLIFEMLARANPHDAYVLCGLGAVAAAMDDVDRARHAWRASLAVSRSFAQSAFNLAELELREGNPTAAAPWIRYVLEHTSDGPLRDRAKGLEALLPTE
ncbi:MAG: hypothetical protein AAF658_00510 [Myxococcota bacterium]